MQSFYLKAGPREQYKDTEEPVPVCSPIHVQLHVGALFSSKIRETPAFFSDYHDNKYMTRRQIKNQTGLNNNHFKQGQI